MKHEIDRLNYDRVEKKRVKHLDFMVIGTGGYQP